SPPEERRPPRNSRRGPRRPPPRPPPRIDCAGKAGARSAVTEHCLAHKPLVRVCPRISHALPPEERRPPRNSRRGPRRPPPRPPPRINRPGKPAAQSAVTDHCLPHKPLVRVRPRIPHALPPEERRPPRKATAESGEQHERPRLDPA